MGQITFRHSTNVMITTRQYHWLNRLRQTLSSPTGPNQPPFVHGYDLNAADQRTRIALGDGSYWVSEHDSLGQVKSGKRYWSDGTPVAGQQFEYAFDDIGNRNSTKAGGDQLGAGLRSASYTNNTLNQITGRGVPSAVDVIGVATAAATVSVNGSTGGVYRRGDYFRRELSATNTSAPQWLPVGVTATSGGTNTVWPTGYVLVPPAGQTFLYDADGNLTNDTVWVYSWDAENRLLQMTNTTAVTTSARKKSLFQYDHQGRRIGKTVYPWASTDYSTTPTVSLKFVYDQWNLLAELNATNNAVIRSCMWGVDLSGSEQGAGGVGGLLRLTYFGASTTNAFVAHDGNGNVIGLVDANGGTNVAEYIYGPFAEPIVVTGPLGKLNPFRFSTKYTDDETDFLYYGYRYYSPSLGRWLNRDPIEEQGGPSLYGFSGNRPVETSDVLGLWWNHRPFIESAVKAASLRLATTSECLDRIFGALWMANSGQDDPFLGGLLANERHYNRKTSQTGSQGEAAYHKYLSEERVRFQNELQKPTTSHCRRALFALGRLSHSWEDFFIHAIRRDGKGGKENSAFPGWTAWTATPPVTGNPGNRASFWPSSFSPVGGGEHPGGINNEPVLPTSPEYGARHSAARSYTTEQLGPLLQLWMSSCRCACEKSWDLSWYTTEFPLR